MEITEKDVAMTEIMVESHELHQKRKPTWGPTVRVPRPRRVSDDGKTVLQRAKDLKKCKNLETHKKNW